MDRTLRTIVVLAAASGLAAGCRSQRSVYVEHEPEAASAEGAQAAPTIVVVAREHLFEPAEITVDPGQKVRIQLENQGQHRHGIDFELPRGGEVKLQEPVSAGGSGYIEFNAPLEPGTYTFYCPMEGHREKGMEGKLHVRRRE